ncbi:MAG: SdrD B-like domain-containing protein [Rivularia sp. (in: cyanobacteria)]
MPKKKPPSIHKNFSKSLNYIGSISLILWAASCFSLKAYAEGSRDMYPSGSQGNRGSILWTNQTWGGTQNFNERTLLRVFAKEDEYILMGSSAVNVNQGDILVYNPGTVTGDASKESLPINANFSCKTQGDGRGKINSRAEELAGPQSVDGNGNTGGYKPCFYKAPTTGVYYIAMYGPSGGNSSDSASSGANNQTIDTPNTGTNQSTGISAWDVTVRSSDQSSTTDLTGRLFTFLIAMNMGNNGKKLNSTLYPVTVDGYRYKVTMRGLDPFGFRIFGNQIGNLDSDGKTPLYRDVLGSNGNVDNPEGGTSTAPPQFPIFFNQPSNDALNEVTLYDREGKNIGSGIPLAPIPPEVTNPNFQGTSSGNTSTVNTGGTFTFNTNVPANYQIIISRDGINYDPSNPQNRVLRGSIPISGQQTVTWNGNDNSAQSFPVGTYSYKIQIQSGEYHFPISDAENNVSGGPTIELLNATNPLGNFTAFFDDRMYTTIGGTQVRGTKAYDPNGVLCGGNPPNPPFSDPINGGDSTSATFRNFGTNTGGNTNSKCTGSFGDTKTLDTWIYVPSEAKQEQLNIIAPGFDISGTLYEDTNTNGDFDTTEPKLPKDITVKLLDSDNNIITTTNTDNNGNYTFTGVSNGDYKIQVDTTDTDIPTGYTLGTPNDLAVTVSGSPITDQNFGFSIPPSNPIVLLIKRITAINQIALTNIIDGVDNGNPESPNYVPAPKDADDNHPNWISNFLRGEIAGVKVQPNDEIEYTIYFLSAGDTEAKSVLVCDRVPSNVTFIPNSFNNQPQATAGLQNSDRGILWFKNGDTQSLTNVKDGDAAQYFPPGVEPSTVYFDPNFPRKKVIDCGGSNTNGAVVVNLQNLPNATEPGTTGSYGFIRFRGKVK